MKRSHHPPYWISRWALRRAASLRQIRPSFSPYRMGLRPVTPIIVPET
jgi:hypothetical protein